MSGNRNSPRGDLGALSGDSLGVPRSHDIVRTDPGMGFVTVADPRSRFRPRTRTCHSARAVRTRPQLQSPTFQYRVAADGPSAGPVRGLLAVDRKW